MSTLTIFEAHGASAIIGSGNFSISLTGFGSVFVPKLRGESGWIYVPITAAKFVVGGSQKIRRVELNFATGPNAWIDSVEIWRGQTNEPVQPPTTKIMSGTAPHTEYIDVEGDEGYYHGSCVLIHIVTGSGGLGDGWFTLGHVGIHLTSSP